MPVEPNEREPSYYEVSLTNRQVVIGLVSGLVTLFAAFLSGVWFGRIGAPARATSTVAEVAPAVAASRPEQITFFAESEKSGGSAAPSPSLPALKPEPKPALPAATPAELEAEKLRQTLVAEIDAHREPTSERGVSVAAPGTRVESPAVAISSTPAFTASTAGSSSPAVPSATGAVVAEPKPSPSAPAVAGSIWIQVYSSNNRERAREIVASLERAALRVRLVEATKDGATSYRVRVGPYPTRGAAEIDAVRLRRELRLDTWVTDTP